MIKVPNVTEERIMHFPNFHYSFSLSESLDILVLPYGVFNANFILTRQNLACLRFFLLLWLGKVRYFVAHIKILKSSIEFGMALK